MEDIKAKAEDVLFSIEKHFGKQTRIEFIKRVEKAKEGGNWVTIHGNHVLFGDDGQIVGGHPSDVHPGHWEVGGVPVKDPNNPPIQQVTIHGKQYDLPVQYVVPHTGGLKNYSHLPGAWRGSKIPAFPGLGQK